MKMNRREMLVATGTGAVALATVGAGEGCNATQWITTVLNDLPTVLQVISSIIAIIGAAQGSVEAAALAVAQKAAADATAALKAAQAFVTQYQANAQPGLLNQIDDALSTAQAQLGSILGVLHINNQTLQATLAAGIGAALTAIVAIQALVPPPPAATSARLAMHKVSDNSAVIKRGFNESVAAAGSPQFAI